MLHRHVGIDFGAKAAGTSAICFQDAEGRFKFYQSKKGSDADQFIRNKLRELKPSMVFIDAPLSLPAVYYGNNGKHTDYFYRESDRQIGGMSPMFMGGITARAIKLKDDLRKTNLECIEVYPKKLKQILFPENDTYKTSSAAISYFLSELHEKLSQESFRDFPGNWHQVDALLAWWSGRRYYEGSCEMFGDETEGYIVV